jgi:hypothetical protein
MNLLFLLPLLLCSLDVTQCLVSDSRTSSGLSGNTVDSTDPTAVTKASETEEGRVMFQKRSHEHPVVRRDVEKYNVLAHDGSNVTDTEEFLKSKIEGDKGLYQVFHGEDVIAWGNVTLTPDAKSEVESHKGVQAVTKSRTVSFNRALPSSDYSQQKPRSASVTRKNGRLQTRADPWKKIVTLDDGLKMISQYPYP